MINDKQLSALKMLIYSELTTETVDEIKQTDLYNGKIKSHCKVLQTLLTPMLNKHIPTVYNVDPTLTTNLFQNVESLVTKIAKLNVVDIMMLNQIHDHYKKYPEDWRNLFEVEFNEIN